MKKLLMLALATMLSFGLTSWPEAALCSLVAGASIAVLAVADSVRCGTRE